MDGLCYIIAQGDRGRFSVSLCGCQRDGSSDTFLEVSRRSREGSFSAMNQMPTVMKCVLPAPLEFGEKTLTAFEIQLAITDMTLASLEIPPEVLEDAE